MTAVGNGPNLDSDARFKFFDSGSYVDDGNFPKPYWSSQDQVRAIPHRWRSWLGGTCIYAHGAFAEVSRPLTPSAGKCPPARASAVAVEARKLPCLVLSEMLPGMARRAFCCSALFFD